MLKGPFRTVGQRNILVITHTVGFNIGLIDEVQAILVAQFVPSLGLRIMGSPDGIDIMRLHGQDIELHRGLIHHVSFIGMMLVHVDPL